MAYTQHDFQNDLNALAVLATSNLRDEAKRCAVRIDTFLAGASSPYTREERIERAIEDYTLSFDIDYNSTTEVAAALFAILDAGI